MATLAKEIGTDVQVLRYGNVEVAQGTGYLRIAQPVQVVPYGTRPNRGAARRKRADAFVNEMVRIGADDFEADYVRERVRTFIESVLFGDGAPELTEQEYDEELDEYMNKILRAWVVAHMKKRGVKPNK